MDESYRKAIRIILAIIVLLLLAFLFIFTSPLDAHNIILLIALVLIVIGGGNLLKYKSHQSWFHSTARLTSFEVKKHKELNQGPPTIYLYPAVEYEYEVDGTVYKNDVVAFEKENIWVLDGYGWDGKLLQSKAKWSQWKVGMELPVFIDPENKEEAVLIVEISKRRRSHHLAFILAGVMLSALWLMFVYTT